MNEMELRHEICRVGRSLFERGYVHATAGNISVRLEDGYLITPSDACLGFLDPDHLARSRAVIGPAKPLRYIGASMPQMTPQRASSTPIPRTSLRLLSLGSGLRTISFHRLHPTSS
jgi:hypothetical protein